MVGRDQQKQQTEPAEPGRRERAWPVRAWSRLTGPFSGALMTGVADPPTRRPAWRTPDVFQHLSAYLPISRIDIVIVGEIITAIAIFSGMVSLFNDANDRAGTPIGSGEWLILAAFASSAPLLLRDVWPLAAWRIAFPSSIFVVVITKELYTYEGAPTTPYPAGLVIMYLLVLYSVGARCSRGVSFGVWALSVLAMWILFPDPSVFLGAIMMAVPLLYGYNVRVRRQAQRQVVEEEQRTEGERAARAVLEERSRIARELHDVVAHHMSVIAIQAEAAPIKAPDDPEVLKTELVGIRGTALEALTELRRILGVLREGDQLPETAPQPDLTDLDQLLASSRAAGQAITMTTSGRPPETLGGVGLAVYRVVQESLSNALRHAPGAPVRVHLVYDDDRLRLRVENDAPSARRPAREPSRGGQGLTGMRERVGTYGGTLTIGPTASGGFAVAATLPLPPHTTLEPT